MNKYVIIGGILVLILGGGFAFSSLTDTDNCEAGMGSDVSLTVVSKKLEWTFEPETITLEQCDRAHVIVINEDNFDHGFAIDAFGVSQRLPANGRINVEFVASKAGTFPFYCSVSCGSSKDAQFGLADGLVQTGPYAGQVRDHFLHIGQFVVKAIEVVTGGAN